MKLKIVKITSSFREHFLQQDITLERKIFQKMLRATAPTPSKTSRSNNKNHLSAEVDKLMACLTTNFQGKS